MRKRGLFFVAADRYVGSMFLSDTAKASGGPTGAGCLNPELSPEASCVRPRRHRSPTCQPSEWLQRSVPQRGMWRISRCPFLMSRRQFWTVSSVSTSTKRTQYPLSKEYTLNHNIKAPII